jgi:hypothetical protein
MRGVTARLVPARPGIPSHAPGCRRDDVDRQVWLAPPRHPESSKTTGSGAGLGAGGGELGAGGGELGAGGGGAVYTGGGGAGGGGS